MLIEKVRQLSPLDRFCYWIRERESIRQEKGLDNPLPWTDDVILQSYRFTNVRRMDDRVSRWLMNNWYRPHVNHRWMLPACAIARFFNKESTLEAITHHVFRDGKPALGRVARAVRKLKKNGPVFNAAYMVRGNDGADKVEAVLTHYVKPLIKLAERGAVDPSSMQRTWQAILPSHGLGSFMAGQITADLRWAWTGRWADKDTWAPVGPGSAKGLALVLRPGDWQKSAACYVSHQDSFLADLQYLVNRVRGRIDASIADRLEMMDWQNCCCEISKYTRVLFGEGRPKQLYPGKGR